MTETISSHRMAMVKTGFDKMTGFDYNIYNIIKWVGSNHTNFRAGVRQDTTQRKHN